jgi:hypothetical protein
MLVKYAGVIHHDNPITYTSGGKKSGNNIGGSGRQEKADQKAGKDSKCESVDNLIVALYICDIADLGPYNHSKTKKCE